MACTGTTTHTAYWVFKLTVAGNAIELPAFFDLTAGAEQALGTSKVTFCGQPDDLPAGTPGRAPFGIKLVDAVLTLNAGVYTNPTAAGPVHLDIDLDAVQPRRRHGQCRRHRLRDLGDAPADPGHPEGDVLEGEEVGHAGRPGLHRRAVRCAA